MTENEIFHKIAEKNFQVFSICSEDDVDFLRSIYKDKEKLYNSMKNMIMALDNKLKSITRVEIFCLLTEYLFDKCKETTNIEICAIFSIYYDTLRLSLRKNKKKYIFNFYKNAIIKHAMDRPPYQIGILSKSTVEKMNDFFIENIYTKFEFLTYMLTKRKNVEIVNKELFEVKLPHILDLQMGTPVMPRSEKILKQYLENRKPKTDLEQKIEMIIEFERERLDKQVDDKFIEQDQVFSKKLEDLLSKKKK